MFINPDWKQLDSLKAKGVTHFRTVATRNRIAIADAVHYTHEGLKMAMGLSIRDKTNDRMLLSAGSLLVVKTYQKELQVTQEDQLFNDLASVLGVEVRNFD